jgi:hypothetical protein
MMMVRLDGSRNVLGFFELRNPSDRANHTESATLVYVDRSAFPNKHRIISFRNSPKSFKVTEAGEIERISV